MLQKVDFFQKFVNRHLTRSNDKIALLTSDQLASSNMIFLLNNPDFSAFQTIFFNFCLCFECFVDKMCHARKMAAKFELLTLFREKFTSRWAKYYQMIKQNFHYLACHLLRFFIEFFHVFAIFFRAWSRWIEWEVARIDSETCENKQTKPQMRKIRIRNIFFCEKVKIDCKTWSKIVNFMMHKQFFGDRLIRGIPRIEKIGRQVQTGIKMQDSGIFA